METTIEAFLETLIERFQNETHEQSFHHFDGRVVDGDGEQSLEYLAIRCFKGRSDHYQEWLEGHHFDMGTLTPLEILYHDPTSRAVRKGVLDKWFADKKLVIPGPPLPKVVWENNGGFARCTLVYPDRKVV